MLPSRGTSTSWRNGLTGASGSSTRVVQSPALGEEQSHVPIYARGWPAEMQLGRGPGDPVGHQAEHKPAMNPWGNEG